MKFQKIQISQNFQYFTEMISGWKFSETEMQIESHPWVLSICKSPIESFQPKVPIEGFNLNKLCKNCSSQKTNRFLFHSSILTREYWRDIEEKANTLSSKKISNFEGASRTINCPKIGKKLISIDCQPTSSDQKWARQLIAGWMGNHNSYDHIVTHRVTHRVTHMVSYNW